MSLYDSVRDSGIHCRIWTFFFGKWFAGLDPVTAARVDKYIRRLEAGNFGAAKALGAGLYELRLDFGRVIGCITGVTAKQLSSCLVAGVSADKTLILAVRSTDGKATERPKNATHTTIQRNRDRKN